MDEKFRALERKYQSGNLSENQWVLAKLNNDLKMGYRPRIGSIMTTPAGVVYFNGIQWEFKSPPPNLKPQAGRVKYLVEQDKPTKVIIDI